MRRSRLGVVALLLAVGVGLLAAPASTRAQAPTRPLAEGWNNVSYPGLPLDVEAALGAAGAEVEAAWAWEAESQGWLQWSPTGPTFLNTLTELERDGAYWLRLGRATTWRPATGGPLPPPQRALAAGWNNVTYGGPTLPVSEALGAIAAEVEAAWAWETGSQSWLQWSPTGPTFLNTLEELERDGAYWLRLGRAATWRFDGGGAAATGESTVVLVPSEGADGGTVAVLLIPPERPRYAAGAPVLLMVNSFISVPSPEFDESLTTVTSMGFVYAAFLWPGVGRGGLRSEGELDNGGEQSIRALRDVARFVSGEIAAADGRRIGEILSVPVLTENVGLYAFSNPGIAAVNALALYGEQLRNVRYFVGRENPTSDATTAVEVGYFDDSLPVPNPTYNYPADYTPTALSPDYSLVRYDAALERPYFDLDGDGVANAAVDHVLGSRVPSLFGKRCYSAALSQALRDNGALSDAGWPADLCRPEEAAEWWGFRATPARYPLLASRASDLAVLLVFAKQDHVQPAPDAPHIHQAYDGFSGAGLWVRLNPDAAYVEWVSADLAGFPDNDANDEPSDWLTAIDWAHPTAGLARTAVPLAAVAEMADRVQTETWDANLSAVLVAEPRAELGTP